MYLFKHKSYKKAIVSWKKNLTLLHNLSINKYVKAIHLYTIRKQLSAAFFGLILLVSPYRG